MLCSPRNDPHVSYIHTYWSIKQYIVYQFTLNDLILFHEYVHSHSRSNFLFTTVAIFIQHFVRIPLYASLNPRLLHASGNTFFEDTRTPNNVFLVSMDTPWGILKNILYGEAPPGSPTPYPFIYHFWQERYPFRIPCIEE